MTLAPWVARTCRVLAVAGAGALVVVSACLLLLGLPRTATLVVAFSALVLLGRRLRPRARAAAALALLTVATVAWRTPLRELQGSLDRLREAKDRRGAAGLGAREALGVYALDSRWGWAGSSLAAALSPR